VHANVNLWPTWHRGLPAAKLSGRFGVGSSFRTRLGCSPARATLTAEEPARRVVWRVRGLGAHGLHKWSFEPREHGVFVRTSVALDGWRLRLLRTRQQRVLERELDAWLAALKARAERLPRLGRRVLAADSRRRR
jgi:hypothetical protein